MADSTSYSLKDPAKRPKRQNVVQNSLPITEHRLSAHFSTNQMTVLHSRLQSHATIGIIFVAQSPDHTSVRQKESRCLGFQFIKLSLQ